MTNEHLVEIEAFLRKHRHALCWDPAVREVAEAAGISITQAGFYYPVPTLADVAGSFEYESARPFWNESLYNEARLAAELQRLIPFAAEFEPPVQGDKSNPEGYFVGLGPFGWSDAFAYYAMIRSRRPKTIVEIGSGASTLIAIEAVKRNGSGRIICVEPYPPAYLLERSDIELVKQPAQSLSADAFNNWLEDGDILFIDSTHTVKSGSDCVHLYLRVLPNLTRDLAVHVHDIFLPEGLPRKWLEQQQIYWAEQYLLMAYLLDNGRTTIIYGSEVNRQLHPELLSKLNGGKADIGGGSFWFELAGRQTST